jgi:hypothetical protein
MSRYSVAPAEQRRLHKRHTLEPLAASSAARDATSTAGTASHHKNSDTTRSCAGRWNRRIASTFQRSA